MNNLVLVHYVGKTQHEVFVFAGVLQIGHEDHLNHGYLSHDEPTELEDGVSVLASREFTAPRCLATVAADIAIGLDIDLDERRVSVEEFEQHKGQWHLLDFSATTEWKNKGGYGTPASGPE